MTLDEMKDKARIRVESENPGATNVRASRVFENLLDGTVVVVNFDTPTRPDDSNHIFFGQNEIRTYRWGSEVLAAVAASRERNWFFRFLEFAGIGGLIALILILVFSFLLFALAFSNTTANPTVVEVVKSSFTIILGFFFGSQVGAKK